VRLGLRPRYGIALRAMYLKNGDIRPKPPVAFFGRAKKVTPVRQDKMCGLQLQKEDA